MIIACDDESDTDVGVSELILGLTDMSLLVCLGFIKVNADLVASWSERGIVVSTLEDWKAIFPNTYITGCNKIAWIYSKVRHLYNSYKQETDIQHVV